MMNNMKAVSDTEIELLGKLQNTLIDMAHEDAINALSQMEYLVTNRNFGKQKQVYANTVSKIGEYYGRHGQIDQATEQFSQMLDFARKNKLKKMEITALSNLALCKAQLGKFLDAIESWKLILPKNRDVERRINILSNISAGYGYVGEGSLSLKYAFDALNTAEINKLEELKISPLINIGTAYERDKMHQKALDYWLIALDLAKRFNATQSLYNVLNNIALAYNALENKKLALKYAFESLELREKCAFMEELAAPLNNIGFIYETHGDPDSALEYYEKALEKYRLGNEYSSMANCIANFASIHIKKGDYQKARGYLEEALETVRRTDAQNVAVRVMNMLAEVYAKLGDYVKAYEYMRQTMNIENELNANRKENSISVNEANYYKRKIELQAEVYRKKNKELKHKNKLIRETGVELQKRNAVLNHTVEMLNWLVSVISHDVRAPLGNFTRMLGMMLDGSIAKEEHEEILQSLKNSGEHVYKLVDEMLDGIRLQRRKLDFYVDLVRQDLVPILMSIFSIYLPIAIRKRIDLTYNFSEEVIEALVDTDLFKIVIRNLLNNALKFTDEQGSVDISVSHEGDYVRLCVSDTGKGMDSKTIKAINDGLVPEINKDRVDDGIGLGLSLCRNALLRMNSSLEIESSPGKGSKISMNFPIKGH